MNTPAHILIGAAAFGKAGQPRTIWAAAIGGVAPDLSLYLMAGFSLTVLGIPAPVVFGDLYYSDAWQTVFAIDNSVFVWGLILAVGWKLQRTVLTAFAAAALLHLALDFPLHAGDGRAHFWPLSRWVWDAPISYWDSTHYAMWVMPAAIAASAAAYVVLWRKGIGSWAKAGFAIALAAELWVMRQWVLFF